MTEEIKTKDTEAGKDVKPNDGFVPIPTGDTPADSRLPAGRQGFGQRQGQRSGGFGQNRRPGFGRAGVGRDRPKDEFETKLAATEAHEASEGE